MELIVKKSDMGISVHSDYLEFWEELKSNTWYKAKLTRERSNPFNRKFHHMMTFAYKNWDVDLGQVYHGVPVTKCYEDFLEKVMVMAGHHRAVFSLDGKSFELKRKKINFFEMKQDEFEQVFRDCSQVIIDKIMPNYTMDEFLEIVEVFM